MLSAASSWWACLSEQLGSCSDVHGILQQFNNEDAKLAAENCTGGNDEK